MPFLYSLLCRLTAIVIGLNEKILRVLLSVLDGWIELHGHLSDFTDGFIACALLDKSRYGLLVELVVVDGVSVLAVDFVHRLLGEALFACRFTTAAQIVELLFPTLIEFKEGRIELDVLFFKIRADAERSWKDRAKLFGSIHIRQGTCYSKLIRNLKMVIF